MSSFFEKIKKIFKKKKGLTSDEKKAQLEKTHYDYFNSEEYIVSSTMFHYKNNNSHKKTANIN